MHRDLRKQNKQTEKRKFGGYVAAGSLGLFYMSKNKENKENQKWRLKMI